MRQKSAVNRPSSRGHGQGGTTMGIDTSVRKNWIEIQKKHTVPVNAIGVKIKDSDTKTLKIWKDEGIDQFIKK
jgi:hypothetical protein